MSVGCCICVVLYDVLGVFVGVVAGLLFGVVWCCVNQ